MPKIKTHSGTKKRIKKISAGKKFKRGKAGGGEFRLVSPANIKAARKLMPYSD